MTGESIEPLVDALVVKLSDRSSAHPAMRFPMDAAEADRAGLYAWWADAVGLAVLSAVFDVGLPPLIYAGQAGATSTRSKTERAATLRSRIGGNHLNGNVTSSTFRKPLTAVLHQPLALQLHASGRLARDSNTAVSSWMREHLSVAIAPVDDRSRLAVIEAAVLGRLDPPLNLMGMRATPVRMRLRQLRSELRAEQSA